MRVTRENAAQLIAQGLLPEGSLCFTIRSGADAVPLPALFKTEVHWQVEHEPDGAIVTKHSASFQPFTFYEWNELEVEEDSGDSGGVLLHFLVQTADTSTPVEVLVQREYAGSVGGA